MKSGYLTRRRGEHPLQRHPLLGLGLVVLIHRVHGVDVQMGLLCVRHCGIPASSL